MADKRKLLVLNDDPDLVEMMTSVLTDAGYEVATSVARDLSAVLSVKPDLIMLDCPPGEEKAILNFSQQLRLSPAAHLPILLATSSLRYVEPSLLRDKQILVLVRPYGADELVQGVETLLNETDKRPQRTTLDPHAAHR